MDQTPNDVDLRGSTQPATGEREVTKDSERRDSKTDPERGSLLGRYVVLARLGAGAMGVVFAAYDPDLDRKVALKLLQNNDGSRAARTRLQREAQALAKLDHPNVVSVYDVGEHDGQLFVGMEFVEGRTLGDWMAEVESPRSWREVLSVFIAAGRGLAAAHEAGIVHSDFKPDNVMISRDGRVRVMDFGLARAEQGTDGERAVDTAPLHDRALLVEHLTMTGALVGTPAYMSPEQLAGQNADARSDQFGFCVALYEALYGERPFAGRNIVQLVEAVSAGKISPAPKANNVPAMLRAVIVRGLAVQPEQRWPSMHELLAALADDPSWRRRRRLAAVGLLGLLGGAVWGVTSMVQADAKTCEGLDHHLAGVWDDARRAEVEAAILNTGLGFASDTWAHVQPWLDDYAEQWVSAREQACEATHRGEQSGELLDLRMRCLDERLRHLAAAVDVLAKPDETVLEKAVGLVTSLPTLDRCADVDALTAEIPPPEDPAIAERVAALDEQLIKVEALKEAGKYIEALALVDPVAKEAAQLGYEPLQARAWRRQGKLQHLAGEYDDAEITLEQAYASALGLGMMDEAALASVDLVWLVGDVLERNADGRRWAKHAEPLVRLMATNEAQAEYLVSMGRVADAEGKYEEALRHYERALAIQEQEFGPQHPKVAGTLQNMGNVAREMGKFDDGGAHLERALAIFEQTFGPQHPEVGATLTNLGIVALKQGDYDEAHDYHTRALAVLEHALGPEHPSVAHTLTNLGNVMLVQGKYDEARGYYERALAIEAPVEGKENLAVAKTLANLSSVAYMQSEYDECRAVAGRALGIYETVLGPEHPSLAAPLGTLANVAYRQGDFALARAYGERSLAIEERALGPEHPSVASTLQSLGAVTLSEGKYEEARGYLERALAIKEQTLDPQHANLASTVGALGQLAYSEGKYEEARAFHERALAITEQALGPQHPTLAVSLNNLGSTLRKLGRPGDALPLHERALSLIIADGSQPAKLAVTHFSLAQALWDAPAGRGRDRARARELAKQARAFYAETDENHGSALADVEAWLKAR